MYNLKDKNKEESINLITTKYIIPEWKVSSPESCLPVIALYPASSSFMHQTKIVSIKSLLIEMTDWKIHANSFSMVQTETVQQLR